MGKLRINSYFKEEGKKVCFSINGRFGDVSDAAEIKQKAEEFRQLAVMFVTFSNSMDDLDEEDKIFMEIVKSVVKYISIAEPEADNEVQLTLSVPLADLSNLDITKCMEAFGQFAGIIRLAGCQLTDIPKRTALMCQLRDEMSNTDRCINLEIIHRFNQELIIFIDKSFSFF